MHVLMSYQITLLSECLITHFTGIRTLTTMYAMMCYKTALLSEGPITHFTFIWMLTPLYITGISTFSTVYMMMFIQRTLVKTQRLNIRIYCERKNNYIY
jgi:low affinity Fe/Cu permease